MNIYTVQHNIVGVAICKAMAEELARMTIEVCIVSPSAAQNGYMMDVYPWNGNAELCSTEQIDSF